MPVPNESIRQIALEIYGGCNYKCPMCPQAEGRESEFLKRMPFDVFKKVVDEGKGMGVEVISLQGSGEPTIHPEMPRFASYVKSQGLQCISLTNGFMLTSKLSRALIESGLDILRISAIGYDRESYHKWMSKDAFDLVRSQVKEFLRLNREMGGKTELTLYHLILNDNNIDAEVEQYRRNWIDDCGAPGEIWKMHNWGGQYEGPYHRQGLKKRSCGRPASPYLTVRAGGADGHNAAVVPCCFVLGQDSKAVLGHLDTQTIKEVVAGPAYQELRDKHAKNDFDSIDYCKNCDQLYDAPESLVWTNIPGKKYGQSKVLQDLDYRKWTV
jgi:pyruvate-formate lyase-activating enzyme